MATFTLTGTFTHQDGVTPVVGSPIEIDADPFPFGGLLQVGSKTVTTDANGKISITRTTGVTGLYYVVRSMAKTPLFNPTRFLAPTAGSTVDISSLVFYNPTTAPVESEILAARDAALAAASAVQQGMWAATTAYTSGQTVNAPDGTQIKANSSRTSRASFDATEQTFWTPVATKSGTLEQAALGLTFVGKNKLTFDIRDFLAVADHVTDNATPINNAITAANTAGGGEVLVPRAADVWATGSTITMKAGVTLRIEGTLKALASHAGVGVTLGDISNVTICGSGTIDMNKAATTSSSGATPQHAIYVAPTAGGASFITIRDVAVQNSWQSGIQVSSGASTTPITDILIENVRSIGNGDKNIDISCKGDTAVAAGLSTSRRIRIRRCTVTNPGVLGIRCRGVSQVYVEQNTVLDSGSATSHGICMGAGSAGTTNDQATDFVITGNVVRGFVTTSQWGIIVSARCTRFTVANNVVTNNWNGISCDLKDPNNTTTLIEAGATVVGNVVRDNTGTSPALSINLATGLTVVGNSVVGNGSTGIALRSSYGLTCTANIVRGNALHGIDVIQATSGVNSGNHVISGNVSTGNNTAAGANSNYHTDNLCPYVSSYGGITSATAPAEVSLASSTTETAMLTYTVPASSASVGTTYRVTVAGLIDNQATSGTLTFRIRWGGVAGTSLAGFAIPSQAGAATGQQFFAEYLLTVRSIGGSGSAVCSGQIRSQFSASAPAVGGTVTTVSTTADADLVFSAQWATSSASNVCKLEVGAVEVVKV